jgi:hypothetical protein
VVVSEIGKTCRVIEGASDWMKKRNYWCGMEDIETIDGLCGIIKNDYTILKGEDAHYEINFGVPGLTSVGVNPQWITISDV